MDTNSIGTVASNAAALASSATTGSGQTLGENQFLQLLMTQLQNQDPMSPMDNTQFIAQMAQFSTLQQTQTMQQDLAGIQAGQVALQASSLLGQTVQVQPSSGQAVSGVVSAVNFQGANPTITIDGQTYDLSQVVSLSDNQSQ